MRRGGIGATYRRENKKKRYTQKLTKKTKEEIKNRGGNTKSRPRTSYSTPGSRVGTTVHNESRDRVKAVIKSALKSNNKPVSKTRLNQSLGGRAGTTTERHKLKSYDSYKSNKGLTDSESARKSEFKRATSYQGMRLGESRKDLASGFYSNKKSESERTKEKANVRKNIEKGYNKKAENSTASFLAGLTKSDKTIETASKALLDKKADTSKVKKTSAYKAGDTVQELASYAIAPTEAAAEKIGAKVVEHTASKILQNSVKSLSRKEAKALLKKAAAKDAIKEIGGKGIAKAATKTANKKAVSAATKGIKDKAVKDAIKEAGEKAIGSRVKRQLAKRGGDVAANAAFNAKYAVDRATDEKGRTNWGEAAKDFALNTGLDVGIGGSIDSVAGKIRKVKARNAEGVAKAESKIRENITKKANARASRAEARKLERETAKSENTINIGTGRGKKKKTVKTEAPKRRHEQTTMYNAAEGKKTAVRGKKGARSSVQYDAGETVRGMQNRINKLESEGKITSKEAKRRRNYLAKAYENITGRTGVVERSGQFSRITKKGLEDISNGKVGDKSLTFGSRFKGTAEKIGIEPKRLANKTYTAEVKKLAKAEQALDKQIANATGEQKSMLQRFKDKIDSRKDAPQSVSKDYESVENAEVKGTINNAENELKSPEISKERENLIARRNEIEQQVKDGKLDPEDAADDIGDIDERLDELEDAETTAKTEPSEASTGKTEYRETVKEQDKTHKRKEDDTITEKNSPSMAEVDSVREMNEPRTTHDDNLTKAGRERHEKLREKKAYEEELDKANEEKSSKSDGEKTKVGDTDDIVGTEPKKNIKAEINKGTTKFKRAFVDSMAFTEKQAKRFAEINGDPEFAKRVTGNINNLRQASQQAAHSLEVEQLDIHGNKVGESGYNICRGMKKRGTATDVYDYLLNMHHADRVDNAADDIVRGSDADKRIFPERTPDEARDKAREIYDKYVEAGRKDEFMKDVQDVVRYFRNDLRSQMLSGVISEDTFRHYIDTYPNYIPTHRVGKGTSNVPKVNSKSAVEYTAKGSDAKVLPLEQQMQISTTNTFTRSAMNDVARDIADMHEVPSEAYNALTGNEIEPIDTMTFFDVPEGKLRWTKDGEWKEITVDKNFLKDLEDSQKTYFKDSLVMKGLANGNAAFKALITSYSPTFMVRNFMRDVPEGWFQSQNMRLNIKNMPSGFKSILTNDDWYRAYVRQGGSHAQFINPEKIFNKDWKILKPFEKLERLNEITEQIPRMAEFRGYLEKLGVTPQTATVAQLRQASQAAADVTVNFGRGGSVGRLINKSLIPFFNPAIQGTDKFIRVLTQDKSVRGYAKLLTKAAVLGIAPAVLNDMVLADDKNYKKISDRDRAINYYVPLDADNPLAKLFGSKTIGAKDGEIFLKIPKARIMSVFGAGTQKAMGNLPDTDMLDLVAIAKDQIGPVGIENNIFHQFVNAKNNKTWYDTPIESAGDQFEYKDGVRVNKPMHKRYDANTSSISIAIADALHKATGAEVSPKRLDYLIDSYTGVAGDIALSKTKKAAQRGYWAKSFSTDTVTQSDIQSKYYDKLTSDKTSSKDRKKMAEWSDRISVVKKAIDNVQNSNSKNKEKEVRELTKLRNSLMEKAVNGKTSKDPTGDIRKVADVLGAKKTFDMVANKNDKKVLKKYGKADDKFLNSYVAVKELTAGQKGKPSKAAQAVAIVNAGGDKKVAKAFGVTQKSGDDIKSAYKRAKDYFKNGGSVEEFKRFQNAAKNVKGKGTDQYMNKAYALAKMGASDRAYAVFDIKDTKVTKARNMAAVGITPKDVQKHRGKADTSGNNYLNKAEVMAYVSGLKGSRAKKSVIYDSLAFWRNNGNPYGSISASAKQAADKKFNAKYGGGKSSDEGKAGPVPLKRGYQIENGKRKPNGKTIGSIGERVSLPAGRTASELKEAERKGEIKKVDVTERIHNAFGSRIGDTVKKKVYKATTIKDIKKNKDGSVDITFANGETWRNPVKKTPEDKTELSVGSDGGSGGGRRGYGRRGYRRYGRGGGGGSRSSGSASLEMNDIKLIGYGSTHIDSPKKIKAKGKVGLTKAQLRDIMKMAVILENSQKTKKQSTQDIYTIK